MEFQRIVMIVLDSVGIGELPDSAEFGDKGAHTLGHIAERVDGFSLPHLQQMGLGNISMLRGIPAVETPAAYHGKMAEISAGKDTMTGHWELMGLHVQTPFRTYPEGFPAELLERLRRETGRGILGNKPASGTEIIQELGEEQIRTGSWIVYTSADSVLQIAAHEETIPLEELYRCCEMARALTLDEAFAVARVIARPYTGKPGAFARTANRRDYALEPPAPTVMAKLKEAGLDCIAVGKINDIFTGMGVTRSYPTKSNEEGIERIVEQTREPFKGMLFANLVDFDSKYGHRRDPQGYADALRRFDREIPRLTGGLQADDLLIVTADHGNDPVHPGTDHTREFVPLLAWSPRWSRGGSLGIRSTFADVGATIAENFRLTPPSIGTSFLAELTGR